MTNRIKGYFLPALFIVGVIIVLLKPTTESLGTVAAKMGNKLNDAEAAFNVITKDTLLWHELSKTAEHIPDIKGSEAKNIELYFYRYDSLVRWTSDKILPATGPSMMPEGTSFMKLRNGWYQVMKWHDSTAHETLIGLVVVKYQYPFENKFLKNDFELGLNVPHNIEISEQKIQGSVPVKNLKGQTLFSLYVSGEEKGEDINFVLLITQLVLLLVLLYYLHLLSIHIVSSNGFTLGFLTLLASVIILRSLMLWFDQPSEFNKLDLFNPKYYASSVITKSLGDLIIDILLLTWVVLFWVYYQGRRTLEVKGSPFVAGIYVAAIFAFTALFTWVFKTLVMDSVISFELYNILNLSFYSILGLICLALLLISHFLISREAILSLLDVKVHQGYIFVSALLMAIVYGLFAVNSGFFQVILFSSAWTLFFIFMLYMMLKADKAFSVKNIVLYVALYCILSTFLIENLYERRERNQRKFFASRLITDRDFVAEYMFDDISQRIGSDPVIKSFFVNPRVSKREVTARLSSLYLSGYFNKYDLKVYTYDAGGYSYRNHDTLTLRHFRNLLALDSIKPQMLHYVNDTVQNYSYLAFFTYREDSAVVGTMVVRLLPKIYYSQNVYPELLLGENVANLAENSRYNYAIYRHNKLIIQHGDYPYTYQWNKDFQFDNNTYVFIDQGEWEHIIYRFPGDMRVVVTEPHEGLFEPIATFSYIFSFYFIVIVISLFAARFLKINPEEIGAWDSFALSFRTRINYSMLLMIVISFVIIGFITISFFSRQYNNFYNDRLVRKAKVVHASLEYFVQQSTQANDSLLSDASTNALNFEVARLAEINDIDINLYDKEGNLAVASQPAIYDKGLISRKMNPAAYFELASSRASQLTQQENIGSLSYLATYAPVRNSPGNTVAYLGIPYFERSKNISDDVSSFLVALMNVYVFLLICAAVLAYFISNSITRPLTIISEKLRILNLNKKNEPIEWKSKDEIGVLIGEYNKMIKELEQSARKLARSERESAWREMAKQIAHEIKNPLTPMKLSIQYLQRAIDAGDPNIDELTRKVTKTLDEQIENLSSIASAFSSFAKMPKANNEIINLNELLKSIADLFNREGKTTVTFTTECADPFVFADRNQLVSVFNNLVKNALQSVPENRAGFIDINIKEDVGWVHTTVSDNGVGIPQELYDKVFVPNFTTKSSGTGLGLAISQQIIDGAGGKIWFESAENVGTTFFVRLRKSGN